MAGLTPGTRSGLWLHMAEAMDHLRPEFVVIENVRGLLSATAARPTPNAATAQGASDAISVDATVRNLESPSWLLGDEPARPLRALGAVLGDLADIEYDARWIGVPASAVGAPHRRFRIFVLASRILPVPDSSGYGRSTRWGEFVSGEGPAGHNCSFPPGNRPGIERTAWIHQMERRISDPVEPGRGHLQRWGTYAYAVARWEHITGRSAPAPALLNEETGPRPSPIFVEWMMGLPPSWVTNPALELTTSQQIAALGNGVLPLQAASAIAALRRHYESN